MSKLPRRPTWLAALNFCVLQWGGIRLARVFHRETMEQTGWGILGVVAPLSGWGPFKYRWLYRSMKGPLLYRTWKLP